MERYLLLTRRFFDVAFNEVHAKYHRDNIRHMNLQSASSSSANFRKQIKSRVQCSRRLQSIYWPTGKRLSVTGIKLIGSEGSSSVVSTPLAIQTGLKGYWSPVYADKPGDKDKAKKVLDLYAKRCGHLFEFFSLEAPEIEDYAATFKHAKHSSCGEDGIPHGAYKATTLLSAQVLFNSSNDLASECSDSDLAAYNKQLVWFAPKGVSDEDSVAVVRTPNNLSTIFGSNCDSKLCSGTIAFKFVPPTLKCTPMNQRGFCKGRQPIPSLIPLASA